MCQRRFGRVSVSELASIHLHSFSIQPLASRLWRDMTEAVAVMNRRLLSHSWEDSITQDPLGGKLLDLWPDGSRSFLIRFRCPLPTKWHITQKICAEGSHRLSHYDFWVKCLFLMMCFMSMVIWSKTCDLRAILPQMPKVQVPLWHRSEISFSTLNISPNWYKEISQILKSAVSL